MINATISSTRLPHSVKEKKKKSTFSFYSNFTVVIFVSLITNDFSHFSVIIWAIMNEIMSRLTIFLSWNGEVMVKRFSFYSILTIKATLPHALGCEP